MPNLLKRLVDETHYVPTDKAQFDDQLNFIEGPIETVNYEMSKLKQTGYVNDKVWRSSKGDPESA